MDILTDLPVIDRENKAIVIFTNYFTKWVETVPILIEDAMHVAYR